MATVPRTNQFTNPAFTATRTPLVVARNLFDNPLLGNATPELHWNQNGGNATVVTSVVGSGGVDPAVPFRRMHFNTDSTSTGSFGQYVGSGTATYIPATVGLVYSASVYVRHDFAAARNYQCIIYFYNSSNGLTGAPAGTAVLVQPNTWTRVKVDNVTAPAASVRMLIAGYPSAATGIAPAGSNMDMTMPNVDQSPGIQEFFSGASTGSDYVYAWTGAAHASTSTKSAGAVVSTNLCNQPGAEGTTYWNTNSSAVSTVIRDTTVKRSGTQSVRGTNVSSTPLITLYDAGGPMSAGVVGRWYTFSCWMMTNESNVNAVANLSWYDATPAMIGGTTNGTSAILTPGVWTKYTVSAVAPANTVWVRTGLNATKTGATPGMQAWADDACLQEGMGIDTFDGYTASDSDFVYAWSGTPDASTSQKIAKRLVSPITTGNNYPIASSGVVLGTNLFINPVLGGGSQSYWYTALGGATATTSVVTSGGVDPAVPFRRMHFDTDSTSTSGPAIGQQFGHGSSLVIPVTVGSTYSTSVWVRHDLTVARNVTFYLQYCNDAGSLVVSTSNTTLVQPNTWTKLTINGFLATTTSTRARGLVYLDGSATANNGTVPAGSNLDMTMPMVEQAAVGQNFFSGSSSRVGMTDYAWTGTPHASTSIKRVAYQSARIWSLYSIGIGSGYLEIATDAAGYYMPALQRGVTYLASVQAYVDPANPITSQVGALQYSESGTGAISVIDYLPAGFSGERRLSITFTIPTDVAITQWRLRAMNGHIQGALSIWFDNFIVEANPPAVTDTVPWQEGKNWVANPYFDISATGWSVVSQATLGRDLVEYHTAPASDLSVLTRPGGHATYGAAINSSVVTTPAFPVGTQLRWRVWIKANRSGVIQVWPAFNSATPLSPTQVNVTTSWQEVIIDWTADQVINNTYMFVGTNTESSNITVWIDDVVNTSLVPAYFDGNTIRANDYDYLWSGTADASTSNAAPLTSGSAPSTLGSGSYVMYGATGSAPLTLGSGASAASVTGSAPVAVVASSSVGPVGSAPLRLSSGSSAGLSGSAPLRLGAGSTAVQLLSAVGSAPLYLSSKTSPAATAGSAPSRLASGSSAALSVTGSAPMVLASGSKFLVTGSTPLALGTGSVTVHSFSGTGSAPLLLWSYGVRSMVPYGFKPFLDPQPAWSVTVDPTPSFAILDPQEA